jgi:outer membrane protein assembly factor BamB
MPSRRRTFGRRRLLLAVVAVALLALGATAAYVVTIDRAGRDVRGSTTVEFVATDLPERTTVPTTPAPAPRPTEPDTSTVVSWPTYGYDARRLRHAPGLTLRPPFRRIWTFRGRALLEFPPAVAYGRLFLPTFDGRFYALEAATGKVVWSHRTGRCGWATPAVWERRVYATFLGQRATCGKSVPGRDGIVVAYAAADGKVVWRRTTGLNESSPLVVGGLVYVGDWNGDVWALDARTGKTRWRTRVDGRVKGSLAASGGRVYVGAYDGRVYALDARSGKLVWRASAQPRLGGRGTFYSTPSAAYGRVFIGNTDGKVYAYGATTGRLLWSHGTGGYVYGSPAVWRRLILVGSYDRHFYAIDAATGDVRWRFAANGPISGSASVIAGVVYFSTFAERTYALDAATGRELWRWEDGKYSPVVADRERLYLVGLGRLYGMVERR